MFDTLIGLFKNGQTHQDQGAPRKLSPATVEAILHLINARAIPSMPGAAQKAFQLSIDPNAEARDFVEVIESDEALSARVIKIANSVFFERGKQSKTIEESVNVIGINELRCLLNSTTLSEIFPSRHAARAQLWAHDVATALVARTLGQRLLPAKSEILFLGGLMHDIGKLLLVQRAHESFDKILELVRRGKTFAEAEEALFPFTHCEIGQLIAERWNFGAELIEMIACHHRDWSSIQRTAPLATIIKAADIIAHALGLGHGSALAPCRNRAHDSLEQLWGVFAIPDSERKDLLDRAQRSFEQEFELYSGKGT